jgi:antitoxin component HigA of HigAB toxin-antitoxin module
MSHLLDPHRIATESDYVAAIDELESLMLADPDTPAGVRFDELVALIEEYEARTWPAESPRAQQPAAAYLLQGPASAIPC